MKTIRQKFYGGITVSTKDREVIQLWQFDDLVQVKRENIPKLIKILQGEVEKV